MKKTPLSTAQAASLFQHVLRKAGHDLPVSASDFTVSNQCVIVGAMSGEKLAEALFDRLFPRSSSGEYHHFTSYGGFKGIVSSGKLRLYNLHKRFKRGEFRTFCSDHQMTGFMREGSDGNLEGHYAGLMDDLFYTSLVAENCAASERLTGESVKTPGEPGSVPSMLAFIFRPRTFINRNADVHLPPALLDARIAVMGD